MVHQARKAGSRLEPACNIAGIDLRTYKRWYRAGKLHADKRASCVRPTPANKLSEQERQEIIKVSNSREYASLPPTQIVPSLLDKGIYIASESSFYRVLKAAGQLNNRGRARPKKPHAKPKGYTATAPKQVFTWDITYLPSAVRGKYHYLYLIEDIYSRKVVGYEVHERECGELAAALLQRTLVREQCFNRALVLHADNGTPMKSFTLKAKMEELGVIASYSRPSVSDDNPYVESLFKTLKYVPAWPSKGFQTLEASREWVENFVSWYNTEHKHSKLNYVTPTERHEGKDKEILAKRAKVLLTAREKNPARWSGNIRCCKAVGNVHLNPEKIAA